MALTRAQLLAGNQSQGTVLPGQVQAVSQGSGIFIDTDGTISVDASTAQGLVRLNNNTGYNGYIWPTAPGTAGQVLQQQSGSNLGWQNIEDLLPNQPYVIYVSTLGNDLNSGNSEFDPKRTIKAAIASLPPPAQDVYYIISLAPGVYEEICPIIVPRNVSIVGDSMRSVEVRPTVTTNLETIFKVDSAFYCTGITFSRHQGNPPGSQSWCVAFNETADNRTFPGVTTLGAYITRSPYVWNCTSITARTGSGEGGSTSTGATGGGFLVDGASCVPQSPLRSMVVSAFTQVNLDGPGARITNNGYAQLVSFFTTFCTTGVECLNGGQANLEACTTDFGQFGLVADGFSPSPCYAANSSATYPGGPRIEVAGIVDVATDVISVTYPNANTLANGDMVTVKTTGAAGDVLPTPLVAGVDYYIVNSNPAGGTLQLAATSGGSAIDITAAPNSFQIIRQGATQITIDAPVVGSNWFGNSLRPYEGMLMIQNSGGNTYYYAVLNSAPSGSGFLVNFYSDIEGGLAAPLTAGDTLEFRLRSQMTATGHTFEYVGSGTNYNAMPYNGGVYSPLAYIVETNQGKVFSSSTDQRGTFRVGTQFSVDGLTGEVTIDASTFNVAGLNFIGPFSRNGGISTVGVQIQEASNNADLISSLGVPDPNTVPTQLAVYDYLINNVIFKSIPTSPATGTPNALIPAGSTADRQTLPAPVAGSLRFNTDLLEMEAFNGTSWTSIGGGTEGLGIDITSGIVKLSVPVDPAPPVPGLTPLGSIDGSLYWDENLGLMFIRYNDGTSTQWVQTIPVSSAGYTGSFLSQTGQVVTVSNGIITSVA